MQQLTKITAMVLFIALTAPLALADNNILPYWQTQAQHIEKGLNEVQERYQQGDAKGALTLSKNIHFEYYRNSDLESSIRTNVSMASAEALNQDFFELSKLIASEGNHAEKILDMAKQLNLDIQKTLPDLPLTPRLQRKQASELAKKEAQRIENKNYGDDIGALNNALTQVVDVYKAGQKAQALKLIQESFYQYWQRSDLAVSLAPDYKQTIEGMFDRLYKNIQQNKSSADIQHDVQQLQQRLKETQKHKITSQSNKTNSGVWITLFLAGLIVIGFVARLKTKK